MSTQPCRDPLRRWLTIGVATAALGASGCASSATPEEAGPRLDPPTISHSGLVARAEIGRTVRIEFGDGRGFEAPADGFRALTPNGWAGELVIVGSDARGDFVASFDTQNGLPADCYVDNSEALDRGDWVNLRGVLWRKAPGFTGGVSDGTAYPSGTRFCFTPDGTVSAAIAP